MISFPNAKMNLGLDIIEKRQDGFHNLSTCFFPIPLCDALEFVESRKFSMDITGNPVDGESKDNLVVKAYHLLKKDFHLPELSIHLHKVIPSGAGLGGGSADAAFMISMLNTHFELYLDEDLLADYAGQLGSDCSFFIYNRPMLALGRGDELSDITLDLAGKFVSVIKPDFSISTKEAYQKINPKFPAVSVGTILQDRPVDSWKTCLKNDFEEALFPAYPVLADLKQIMYSSGAIYAAMTGSGSAIFGIFEEEPSFDSINPAYFSWTGKL